MRILVLIGVLWTAALRTTYPLPIFDCTFNPNDVTAKLQPPGAFKISIKQKVVWTPNSFIEVFLENTQSDLDQKVAFNQIIIQAHDVIDHVVGRWITDSPNITLHSCESVNDSVLTSVEQPVTEIRAVFKTPSETDAVVGDIDFNAAVYAADGKYWTNIRSVLLGKNPNPPGISDLQMANLIDHNELGPRLSGSNTAESQNSSHSSAPLSANANEIPLSGHMDGTLQETEKQFTSERPKDLEAAQQKRLKSNQEIIQYNTLQKQWQLVHELTEFQPDDGNMRGEKLPKSSNEGCNLKVTTLTLVLTTYAWL